MTRTTDERVADYLGGTMEEKERAAFERELLTNDELAAEVYADQSVSDALHRAAELGSRVDARVVPMQRPGRNWWKVALPLAAVLTLIAIPFVSRDREAEPVLRGSGSGLAIQEPSGKVDSIERFAWDAEPGAISYEVIVRDAQARVVWETTTAETEILPPAGTLPAEFRSGTWTVRALDATGLPLGSRSAAFQR